MIATIVVIVKQKELTKVVKGFVITMLLLALSSAILFEYSNNQIAKNSRPTLNAFREGKNIHCQNKEINNQTYSYEPGTSSFIPLINVVGETFSLSECTIK